MYRVLLLSHGELARELLRTVEMVIGGQPEQEVAALPLQPEQDMNEYYRAVDGFVKESGAWGGMYGLYGYCRWKPFYYICKGVQKAGRND
ncbi:MAG: hypothetical protein E7F15_14340 [Clostridiales bacterium]|nr:hypothetical protein [Clostridiales bacterium]